MLAVMPVKSVLRSYGGLLQTSSGSLRYVCENWSITRIARQSWGGAFLRIYKLKYFIYSILCGFSIPINVFGKGLSIAHRGTIVVNGKARIGENCRIHACVNIGTVPGVNGVAPTIGDNVYIGPGAKIYGNISVASGIMIGANAVVNKSFDEENICIAGAPARKISDMGRFEIEERNSKEFK